MLTQTLTISDSVALYGSPCIRTMKAFSPELEVSAERERGGGREGGREGGECEYN